MPHQRSKVVFQAELNDSRIVGARNPAELRTTDAAVRVQEVRMVEDVARFHTELHRLSLNDSEHPRQSKVHGPVSRTEQRRAACRTQRAESRNVKGGPVVPPARRIA